MTKTSARVPDPSETRLIGAAVAFTLDIAFLAIAGLSVFVGFSLAWSAVLAGLVGLVAAPFLGCRFGDRAAEQQANAWPRDAMALLLVFDGILVAGFAFQGLVGGSATEPRSAIALVAYRVLTSGVALLVLTMTVAVPLGLVWSRSLRWIVHRLATSPR